MTKDWNAVEHDIKDLSWNQKKQLSEVRKIIETRHGFVASTRAFRMKLKEWGLTSKRNSANNTRKDYKKRRLNGVTGSLDDDEMADPEGNDSDSELREPSRGPQPRQTMSLTISEDLEVELLSRKNPVHLELANGVPVDPNLIFYDELGEPISGSLHTSSSHPTVSPATEGRAAVTHIMHEMLEAVLESDSQKLESLLMKHPQYVNYPIGMPFEAHGGKFFNHPAISQCVMLQHPDQTLFDIASALPSGPIMWILLGYNAKGSKHPFGTDLAFHNAIKNGRVYNVQALLMPGRSNIHGDPEISWKPLIQAVFWNQPEVVRLLINRGARVNDKSPWVDGQWKSPLQFCLERRVKDYTNLPVREKCEKILKMLLNAGADVLAQPNEKDEPSMFETFLQPWQGTVRGVGQANSIEMECLEAFVRRGANLKTPFNGFSCSSPRCGTFEHQTLWHSTPAVARLLIDHAAPNPDGNGSGLLDEIVGSCPDAKRHPADTLRDMEVLLKRGADPNRVDSSGFTPLRRCIDCCPAADIVRCVRLLLKYGADPELRHGNRLPPFIQAARMFEDPICSQIMELFVGKMMGRQPFVRYDEPLYWSEGYFPIPTEPSLDQVHWYSESNGDFSANLDRMVPDDIRAVFRVACFSVVSTNFLNAATARVKARQPFHIMDEEKYQICEVIQQRQAAQLSPYDFNQDFVLGLLNPQMASSWLGSLTDVHQSVARPEEDQEPNDILLPHRTPISFSLPTTDFTPAPPPPATSFSATPHATLAVSTVATATTTPSASQPRPRPRALSASSTHSTSSSSSTHSFIPTTTMIRWPAIGEPTRRGDLKKSKEAVLKYACAECADGNLLTKAEVERHRVEHEHSRTCDGTGVGRSGERCRRRFCVRRGM